MDKTKYQFLPMTTKSFNKTIYEREWLIKRILVKDQPCIIGGPKKSLKTSLLIDLALSLGTATPFLGKFEVAKTCKTVIISGESGEATIQETARRVALSKGIKLDDADCGWAFRLPKLAKKEEIKELQDGIAHYGYKSAIIDPLYLCLLSGQKEINAGNLYEIGPLFYEISSCLMEVGCTPLLCHHARKNHNHNSYDPLDLDDLSFAGVAEFARQWILVSRRARYECTGFHELWMGAGGSTGHGGLWGLNVHEGQMADDFTGRVWDVDVLSLDGLKEQKAEEKEARKQGDDEKLVAELLKLAQQPISATILRNKLGWFKPKFDRIFELAKDKMEVSYEKKKHHKGHVELWKAKD